MGLHLVWTPPNKWCQMPTVKKKLKTKKLMFCIMKYGSLILGIDMNNYSFCLALLCTLQQALAKDLTEIHWYIDKLVIMNWHEPSFHLPPNLLAIDPMVFYGTIMTLYIINNIIQFQWMLIYLCGSSECLSTVLVANCMQVSFPSQDIYNPSNNLNWYF